MNFEKPAVNTQETPVEKVETTQPEVLNETAEIAANAMVTQTAEKAAAIKKKEKSWFDNIDLALRTAFGLKTWAEASPKVREKKAIEGFEILKNPENKMGGLYKIYNSLTDQEKKDKLAYAVRTKKTGLLAWDEEENDWVESGSKKIGGGAPM